MPARGVAATRQLAAPALIAAIALGAIVALGATRPVRDPDYFWHLATGRWISAHHAVPATDPFSHTFAGAPWHHVDWLSALGMYLLVHAGGHALCTAAFAALAGVVFARLLWTSARAARASEAAHGTSHTGATPALLLAAGTTLLAASASLFRLTPRPQTLTFALLLAQLEVQRRSRERPRALYAIPPLLALWQNAHNSAVAGVVVLALHALGTALEVRAGRADRARLVPALATVPLGALALLATPRPIDRLHSLVAHLADARIPRLIPEWAPLWSLPLDAAVIAFALLAVVALASAALTWRSQPRWDAALVSAALLALGARSVRFAPLAALALASLACERSMLALASRARARLVAGAALALVAAGLFAAQWERPSAGVDAALFPAGAVRFMRDAGVRGRLYNDFYFGGYVTWELENRVPVFIDGRTGTVYGIAFLDEVVHAGVPGLERFIARYDLGAVLAALDRRASWLAAQPDWRVVYFDDRVFVAVRARDNPGLAARGYLELEPAAPLAPVDRWRAEPDARRRAGDELARARAAAPRSALVRTMEGALALSAGDQGAVERAVADALSLARAFVPALQLRLRACVARTDRTCACAAARELLAARGDDPVALRVRGALRCP